MGKLYALSPDNPGNYFQNLFKQEEIPEKQ